MCIEGPIVTTAASFAASLGYFNLFTVLILAILGDLIPDILYFAIGHWGRRKFLEKYGHYVGVTASRIAKLEKHFELHAGKTLIAIKLSPAPVPGLIIAGISKMPVKKYAKMALLISFPKILLFMALGFYFGHTYSSLSKSLGYVGYLLPLLAVLNILIYLGFKKASAFFSKRIEPL